MMQQAAQHQQGFWSFYQQQMNPTLHNLLSLPKSSLTQRTSWSHPIPSSVSSFFLGFGGNQKQSTSTHVTTASDSSDANSGASSPPASSNERSSSMYHTFLVASAYGISKTANRSILESSLVYRPDNYLTIEPPQGISKDSICGEDAYFIANEKEGEFESRAAGVADGVGGWVNYGVDPGLISRKLMQYAQLYVKGNPSISRLDNGSLDSTTPNFALGTLEFAYRSVTNKNLSGIRAGSTTACIVYVTEGGMLHSANLGDSGFMVLRDDEIVYRSKELQHRFNAPYQIAVCPPERGGTCIMNEPKDAALHKMRIKNGDMIILGTDGLFDNMYDEHIVDLVTKTKKNALPSLPLEPGMSSVAIQQRYNFEIAKTLCLYAKTITQVQNPYNRTPFGDAYKKETGKTYGSGGKVDDITCVVCTVNQIPKQPV